MLSLLERQIAAIEHRLVLLAPPDSHIPSYFGNVTSDETQHRRLVTDMQRLRGSVYLQDGAVTRHDLSSDGLHETPEDARSWHLLMRDEDGGLSACIWYLEHNTLPAFQQLRAQNCPLSRSYEWHDHVRRAVAAEVALARLERVRYSEVGGWAVSEAARCTTEGLMMILATFSLSRALGGALGLATATVRHSSASMLQRLGLSKLEDIPSYYDPEYDCEMELLRFDTRRSSPKYHDAIEMLKSRLSAVSVIVPEEAPVMAGAGARMPGMAISLARECLTLPSASAA
ncbi:MAG: hypothetical protein ABI051_15865 [Vicinamibacterales bacterium]